MQCKDRYLVRITEKYNPKHVTAFVRKNAERRFLGPFNLRLRSFPPPAFGNCTELLGRDEEFQLFTALHYMKYKLKKSKKARDRYFHIYIALRNRAISANWSMVPSCIETHTKKFPGSDLARLMEKGNEALISAVDCFDPWRGYRFCTYAYHAISRSFLTKPSMFEPTITPIDDKLSDSLANECDDDNKELWIERLEAIMDRPVLTSRERDILMYRFGLGDEDENPRGRLTLKEVAVIWDITKERVRQIQTDALNKLKDALFDDPILH